MLTTCARLSFGASASRLEVNTEYRVLSQYAWKPAQPALPPVSTSISAYLFTRKSVRSTDRSSWQLVSSIRMMTRVVFLEMVKVCRIVIRPSSVLLSVHFTNSLWSFVYVVADAHNAAGRLIYVVLDVIRVRRGPSCKPAYTPLPTRRRPNVHRCPRVRWRQVLPPPGSPWFTAITNAPFGSRSGYNCRWTGHPTSPFLSIMPIIQPPVVSECALSHTRQQTPAARQEQPPGGCRREEERGRRRQKAFEAAKHSPASVAATRAGAGW